MRNALTRSHYKDHIPTTRTRTELILGSKDNGILKTMGNKIKTNLGDMTPWFEENSINYKSKKSDKTRKEAEEKMKKSIYTRIVKDMRKKTLRKWILRKTMLLMSLRPHNTKKIEWKGRRDKRLTQKNSYFSK